jgi:hypothetical protein
MWFYYKQISLVLFLNWIREFFFLPYTTKSNIEEEAEGKFRGYSKDKFLKAFGGAINEFFDHPASNGFFDPSYRILAREE